MLTLPTHLTQRLSDSTLSFAQDANDANANAEDMRATVRMAILENQPDSHKIEWYLTETIVS
jgi:hypothetical protein